MDNPLKSVNAPTISQVADAAGVSRSSVSRAFSKPHMLREDTVQHILAIARKIGYVPNHTARALSTGRYANVALIVPDISNPFFPPLIQAAQRRADLSNFCVFLGNSNEDRRQEDKLLDRFASQVEGVVLVSSRLSEERIKYHAARRPLVLINRDVSGIPRVLIDSGQGVAEAVRHLADLGHAHIVYVSGPRQSWSNRQRRKAVKEAGSALGITITMIQAALPTYEAGRIIAPDAVATGATAVIAFDDLIAQGIMAGLTQQQVPIPERMSVVGCDDVLGAATYPALTTVSNRSIEAGETALVLLFELLRTQMMSDMRHVLSTELVVRDSTAAPAQ
jgi:LacI family transcriptional regulator